ncbi:MAG: Tetratricopeptide repeat [Candidatus Parcubacteria bacterium]|jgi:tetratricopeptide (TPR) repeat protein
MKHIYISLFLVSVLIGCATTPSPKHYTPKRGIAYRALELEGAHWDRTESVKVLDGIVENVSHNILTSPYEVESQKTLEIIHRTILDRGFRIASIGITFGTGLTNRTLDCSDLTMVYLEVLERFGATPRVAFTRNHIMVVLRKSERSKSMLLWETTTGKKSPEQILEGSTNSAYLTPFPPELALSAPYIEIAHKLSQEDKLAAAEACYREMIKIHPRCVTGLKSFAALLAQESRYAEAESFLLKAIDLDRTSPELYDFASALYTSMGDRKRAEQMYENLVSLEWSLKKDSIGTGLSYIRNK